MKQQFQLRDKIQSTIDSAIPVEYLIVEISETYHRRAYKLQENSGHKSRVEEKKLLKSIVLPTN